jgi:hypothetical protein
MHASFRHTDETIMAAALTPSLSMNEIVHVDSEKRAIHACPNENAKGGDTEAHSKVGANPAQVVRESERERRYSSGRGRRNELT